MTLTVRSASVTGATTASRALTYAEMDANWAGARTAFSLFARSSDANFNATQAALTETVGVKALRIGSGSSVGLLFPTSSIYGDHYSYVADTTFNGIVDPIKIDGYNPSRVNTAEPSLYWGLEGHYFDGATHYMEENLDYTSSDGLTTKRFFTMQINRATHLATWQWAGTSIQFSNVLDSTPMLFMNSTTLSLGNQSPSASTRIEINGTQNASSSEFGINYLGKAGSGVTNTLACYLSQPGTVAAAFAITRLQHFAIVDASKGAGSTITEQDGFRCTDLTTGATNIAFLGEVSSGSNKWNLSMTGTAQNFLQGVTGIGIAASSTAALTLAAGTTGVASLRVPHGAAPSSPVNGDIWTTTSGLFVRINGGTVGPLT